MPTEYPESYVVWDLETTGLDPERDKILEIAFAVVKHGEVAREYAELLDWGDIEIPGAASAVHGITLEKTKAGGINPKMAVAALMGALAESPAHVTHNGLRFDHRFLEAACRGFNADASTGDSEPMFFLTAAFDAKALDTAALYKGQKLGLARRWDETWQDWGRRVLETRAFGVKYNLALVCQELGIDTAGVALHRAGADVALTNLIYRKLALNL